MKRLLFFLFLFTATTLFGQNKDYPIHAVNFTAVQFTDNFWLPHLKTNHTVIIPASFERFESTGRVKNFDVAANGSNGQCSGKIKHN